MSGGVSQSNTSGSQNQVQNTQQLSNAAPPPWASAALQQAMQTAQSLAQMPFVIQPQPIAGLQPQQREAFQTVENLQGAYTPFVDAALGGLGPAAGLVGQGAGFQGPAAQYQTPWGASQYFGAESAGVLPQLENIFGQQMAQTTGDLVNRAGGTDAERIAVGQSELANQQGLAAGQTLSQLMGQAVTQGQQAGMNIGQLGMNLGQLGGIGGSLASTAGNLASTGQQMGLAGAQAELNAGTLAQQQLQNMQNAIYANNSQAVSWPFQTNAYLSTIASGLTPPAGGNMTQLGSMQGFGQNQSQTKGSSLGGSLGGLMGGLARGGRIAGAEETLRKLLEPEEDEDGHKHHGHGRQGTKAIARYLGYANEPRSELDLIPGSSFTGGGRIASPMKGGGTVSNPVDPQQAPNTIAQEQATESQLRGVPMGLGLPAGYNPEPGWRYDPNHPESIPPAATPFAGAMEPMQFLYPTHVTTPVMPYRNAAWGPPAPENMNPAWESSANIDMGSPRFIAEAEQAGLPIPQNWDLGNSAMQDQLNPWLAEEHTAANYPQLGSSMFNPANALGMLLSERSALTAQLGPGPPPTPFAGTGPRTATGIPGAAMLPPAQQGAAPGKARGGRIAMQGGGSSTPATPATSAAPAAPVAPATTFTGAPALTSPWGANGSYYGIPPPGTVFPGTPIPGVTPGTVLPWTQGASYPNLRAPGTVPGAVPSAPAAPAGPAAASAPTMRAIPQTLDAAGSPTGTTLGGTTAAAAQGVPIGGLSMPTLGVLPTQGSLSNALAGRAHGGRIPMQGGGMPTGTPMPAPDPNFITSAGNPNAPLNNGNPFFGPLTNFFAPTSYLGFSDPRISATDPAAGPVQQAAPTFGINNFSGMGKGGGWGGGGGGASPWMANQNPANQPAYWPSSATGAATGTMAGAPWSGNMGKGFRAGGRIPMQGGGDPAQNPSPGIADPHGIKPLQVGNQLAGGQNLTSPSPQTDPLGGIVAQPQGLSGQAGVKPQMGPPPPGMKMQQAQGQPPKSGGDGGGGGGKGKGKGKGQGQGQGQQQQQQQGQGLGQPPPQAQPPAATQTDTGKAGNEGAPTGPTDPATGIPLTSNQIVPPVQVATAQNDTPSNMFDQMAGGSGMGAPSGGGMFGGDMGGFSGMGDMGGMSDMSSQDMAMADAGAGAPDFGGGGDFGGAGDFGGGFGGFGARGGAFQDGGGASSEQTPFSQYYMQQASAQRAANPGPWTDTGDDSQLARRGGAIGRALSLARSGFDNGGTADDDGDGGGGGNVGSAPELELPPPPLMPPPESPKSIQQDFDNFHDFVTGRSEPGPFGLARDKGPSGDVGLIGSSPALRGTPSATDRLNGQPAASASPPQPLSPAPAPAPAPLAGTAPASFADRWLPSPASQAIRVARQPSGPADVSRGTFGQPFDQRPAEQAIDRTNAAIAQAAGIGQGYGGGQGGNTTWRPPGTQTGWTNKGWLQGPYATGAVPTPPPRPFGAPGVAPPLPQARPLSFDERFAGIGSPLQSLAETDVGKGDRLAPAHPFGGEPVGAPSSAMATDTPGPWPGAANVRSSGVLPQRGPIPYSAPGPLAANKPSWLPSYSRDAATQAVEVARRPGATPPVAAPAGSTAPRTVAPVEPTIGALAQQNAAALAAAGIKPADIPDPGLTASDWAKKYPQYAGHPQIQGPLNQAIAAHQAAVQRYQQQLRQQPQPLPADQSRPPMPLTQQGPAPGSKGPVGYLGGMDLGRGGPGTEQQHVAAITKGAKAAGFGDVSYLGNGDNAAAQYAAGEKFIKNGGKNLIAYSAGANVARQLKEKYPDVNVITLGAPNVPGNQAFPGSHFAVPGAWADAQERAARQAPQPLPAGYSRPPQPVPPGQLPYRSQGTVMVGDKGPFHWISGGAGRGAIPPGHYPVTPGTVGEWGVAHHAIGLNNNVIEDPRYPGHPRKGIEIHAVGASARLNHLATEGCFGVPQAEWRPFKSALMDEIHKNGTMYMHIGPDGKMASFTPNVSDLPPATGTAAQPVSGGRQPRDPWANPVQFRRGGYADAGSVRVADASDDTTANDQPPPDTGTPAQQVEARFPEAEGPKTLTTVPIAGKTVPTTRLPGPGAPTVEQPAPAAAQPAQPASSKPANIAEKDRPYVGDPQQQPASPGDRFKIPEGLGMDPFRAWLMSVFSGDPTAAYKFLSAKAGYIDQAYELNYKRAKDISDETYHQEPIEDAATAMRAGKDNMHGIIKDTRALPAGGQAAQPGVAGAPGRLGDIESKGAPAGAAGAATQAQQQPLTAEQQAVQQIMSLNAIEQEQIGRAYRHMQIPRGGGSEELTQLMNAHAARVQQAANTGLINAHTAETMVRTAKEGWLPLAGGMYMYNIDPRFTGQPGNVGQPLAADDPRRTKDVLNMTAPVRGQAVQPPSPPQAPEVTARPSGQVGPQTTAPLSGQLPPAAAAAPYQTKTAQQPIPPGATYQPPTRIATDPFMTGPAMASQPGRVPLPEESEGYDRNSPYFRQQKTVGWPPTVIDRSAKNEEAVAAEHAQAAKSNEMIVTLDLLKRKVAELGPDEIGPLAPKRKDLINTVNQVSNILGRLTGNMSADGTKSLFGQVGVGSTVSEVEHLTHKLLEEAVGGYGSGRGAALMARLLRPGMPGIEAGSKHAILAEIGTMEAMIARQHQRATVAAEFARRGLPMGRFDDFYEQYAPASEWASKGEIMGATNPKGEPITTEWAEKARSNPKFAAAMQQVYGLSNEAMGFILQRRWPQ